MKTELGVMATIVLIIAIFLGCPIDDFILQNLCHQIPLEEGDYVALRENIKVVKTYHCSRCSEQEAYPCEFRYDLFGGGIAQIQSHEGLGYWLEQSVFPRCSYCRIHHESKGAAWVDCTMLTEVRMDFQEEE